MGLHIGYKCKCQQNLVLPVAQATKASKVHDRVETRTASISGDVAWLQRIYRWPI